jgi:hypothetical protein
MIEVYNKARQSMSESKTGPLQSKGQTIFQSNKDVDLPKHKSAKDKRMLQIKRNKTMEKHFYEGSSIMTEE